ncbi:hypothetical protein L484_010565 [Morus notabilis]|uniref:Generative cell specific-1/HAP2 domain-containing protein n=1 Tax=Morus notabilis TaxID=981085 RepID=W9SZ88_9ROSA|nr:hypothetical protein L484_010565 [Morus notabilis]
MITQNHKRDFGVTVNKHIVSVIWFLGNLVALQVTFGVQILSKSKLEKCQKNSTSDNLNCNKKIVLNLAVPSGSSGGEASIVAEIVEVEENSTQKMQTLRIPPVLTDVSYKPEEYYVKTRKCEPEASAKVVKICERLRDENGHIMEHTEPICCPCGPQRRMPSSCGSVFDKWMKGKPNTAHCLRFPGDWFHVFSIGQRSLGFSVKIQVKTGSEISEVFVGPENRTVASNDNFLRVNLIGDFVGYTNIPSFEDFYLVIPRQRLRFTLDGTECNKIGVGYEAFNDQPNFCSSPFLSCLHNQLWNFWEADQNRIRRKQLPLYGVQGRFERINQHPNAGTRSFSIGVTEVLNTNLLIELSADDVEYVYQRSPGKILSINIPTFEALSQFGVATIKTMNTGEVEASYGLTFDCSKDVTLMEEQFFIMKPKEEIIRSFKLYPATDQAANYDSDYNEVDRAECQFATTSTVLDNGTQNTPFHPPKKGISGFFETIASIWNDVWRGLTAFITGKICRRKCYGFFDFKCHIQYICMSWIVMFGLFLAIFPTVIVLLWLLHQKGLFDPIYDWWENHCWTDDDGIRDIRRHGTHINHHHHHHIHVNKHSQKHGTRHHHKSGNHHRRKSIRNDHRHNHSEREADYDYYLHHVHKAKLKQGRV